MTNRKTRKQTRTIRITARPSEGVIINEPSLVRIRTAKRGRRALVLEIVTADGKVKAVKRFEPSAIDLSMLDR